MIEWRMQNKHICLLAAAYVSVAMLNTNFCQEKAEGKTV
jgi:hypothetical protein